MKFRFAHNNFNVTDLARSISFYREALGLEEVRRYEAEDGSFILVYLGDGSSEYELELTWLRDRQETYDLETTNFIWRLRSRIWMPRTGGMNGWDASVTRIPRWEFILSPTPTTTGWKSFRRHSDDGMDGADPAGVRQ